MILVRIKLNYNEVKGLLIIINDSLIIFSCSTIENKTTIFPEGQYIIKLEKSPKFKRYLWELKGIKGRSEIKIHIGSRSEQSRGCILVSEIDLTELHKEMNNYTRTSIKVVNYSANGLSR